MIVADKVEVSTLIFVILYPIRHGHIDLIEFSVAGLQKRNAKCDTTVTFRFRIGNCLYN